MFDNIYPTLELEGGRGCGTRDPEMPYLCTGVAMIGMPIEHFVYDPTRLWQDVMKRGSSLVKDNEGVYHVVMFVSKNDYPHWWDFVTESRAGGVSRKVAQDFPFDKLTPGQSTMRFVHARGVPMFDFEMAGPMYEENREHCRLHHCKWQIPSGLMDVFPSLEFSQASEAWFISNTKTGYHPWPHNEPCAYSARQMAYFVHGWHKFKGYEVEVDPEIGIFTVHGPSFSYSGFISEYDDPFINQSDAEFKPGMFMWSKITHVEYFAKADKKSEAKAEDAGYATLTLSY